MRLLGSLRRQRGVPERPDRLFRPKYGPCPYCTAAADEWCKDDYPAIDPGDYR